MDGYYENDEQREQELKENQALAEEKIKALTSQENIQRIIAEYWNSQQGRSYEEYWKYAKYEINNAKDSKEEAEYEAMKEHFMDVVSAPLKDQVVDRIMQEVSYQDIDDYYRQSSIDENDRPAYYDNLRNLIADDVEDKISPAVEQMAVGPANIEDSMQNEEFGKFEEFLDQQVKEKEKDELVKKVAFIKIKRDSERRKHIAEQRIENFLQNQNDPARIGRMTNRILASKEARPYKKLWSHTRALALEENDPKERDNLIKLGDQTSAKFVADKLMEELKPILQEMDYAGIVQSDQAEDIEKARKEAEARLQSNIYAQVAAVMQQMDVKPVKDVEFAKMNALENAIANGFVEDIHDTSVEEESSQKDVGEDGYKEEIDDEEAKAEELSSKVKEDTDQKLEEAEEEAKKEEGGFSLADLLGDEAVEAYQEETKENASGVSMAELLGDEAKEEPQVKAEQPQVKGASQVEEEPELEVSTRMADLSLNAEEMNVNLHALHTMLKDADPFYIRSSPEFKNMKAMLTTIVTDLDKSEYLDADGLKNLESSMGKLRTYTQKYLVMKQEQGSPSNTALQRIDVAQKILWISDKYIPAISATIQGQHVVADVSAQKERYRRENEKLGAANDDLGKIVQEARKRLQDYANMQLPMNDAQKLDAKSCMHLLISDRLLNLHKNEPGKDNKDINIAQVHQQVSGIKQFEINEEELDPAKVANFLNHHLENKMIKEYFAGVKRQREGQEIEQAKNAPEKNPVIDEPVKENIGGF